MRAPNLICALVLLLGGCATYHALPLNPDARMSGNPGDIEVPVSVLRMFPQRHHSFNPAQGLDMTDVAILAVANNPQLKIAREEHGIAHAQAFAAGLLPDPVLDLAHGTPTGGPAATSSFGLGLAYDVEALLTHPLTQRAANSSARKVDLNLLWVEWQVIGKAHQLFVRDVYQAKILAISRQEAETLEKNHAQLVTMSRQGRVSGIVAATDLARLQTVEASLHDTERQYLKTRQDLDALLGLSPKAQLHLIGPPAIPELDQAVIERALDGLPHHRPDLLALQAGYQSADARYRQAILEQFPAIQIGFTRSRDADAIYTRGFSITLTLPIFNRNRGDVAIAEATRNELHVQYAVRLAQARAQVEQILQLQGLLGRQRNQLQQAATSAAKALDELQATARPGDVSGMSLIQLQTEAFERRLDLLGLEEVLLEQQVTLQTLLGRTSG